MKSDKPRTLWLIAEWCDHEFLYCGWHLYLRESRSYQKRNKDGDWGWLRRPKEGRAGEILKSLGCEITGDGTTDRDGIGQFARQFPLSGRTVGGKKRGGIKVTVNEYGTIIEPEQTLAA